MKEALKSDLWNIINKEKLLKVNFFKAVHDALLGCKNFNLQIVKMIAVEIEEEYEYSLSYFYDAMEKGQYLEIIEPIKNTVNIFCKKTEPILRNLKNYRDERQWVERSSTILAKKRNKIFQTRLMAR